MVRHDDDIGGAQRSFEPGRALDEERTANEPVGRAAGSVVTPGTEFSPDRTDSIRLNFSQEHQAAVHAARRIAEMVERYR